MLVALFVAGSTQELQRRWTFAKTIERIELVFVSYVDTLVASLRSQYGHEYISKNGTGLEGSQSLGFSDQTWTLSLQRAISGGDSSDFSDRTQLLNVTIYYSCAWVRDEEITVKAHTKESYEYAEELLDLIRAKLSGFPGKIKLVSSNRRY